MSIKITALPPLPEIRSGDDLGALVYQSEPDLRSDDILVVAQKVISKAEGRTRKLDDVQPSAEARELADRLGKDPRLVQIVLDESEDVLRAEHGVLICRTRHGFVCANAGVDSSNSGEEGRVVLLPEDSDASARALRARIGERSDATPAVVITDSFGRAWRIGQSEVAIGCAGLEPLDDWRGRTDADGRSLNATAIAVADQLAAAADLVRSKNGREPVVRIRGLGRFITAENGPGALSLVRPVDDDLFR